MPALPCSHLECQARSTVASSASANTSPQLRLSAALLWLHGCLDSFCICEGDGLGHRGMAFPAWAHSPGQHDEHASASAATPFVSLLKACAQEKDIRRGTALHIEVVKRGLLGRLPHHHPDSSGAGCAASEKIVKQRLLGYGVVLGTALVDMYAKCGSIDHAHRVLAELRVRDVVAWCAIIVGYAQNGQAEEALECLHQMQHEGLSPDPLAYALILKACGVVKAIDQGERIHDEIAKKGLLGKDLVLGNVLVDMYAKCGALSKAQEVLEALPERDVVSWSSLISGYAQAGLGEQALRLFDQMQHEGISPNAVTYLSVLKACGSIGAADKGEHIHNEITRRGFQGSDIALGSALVDMYAKCGVLAKARRVLEELPARNIVSWTALIGGYAQQGQGEQALKCFELMQYEGHTPNVVTLVCVLTACGAVGALDRGERIHHSIAKQGLLETNELLGNALVSMYAKCGAVAKAQQVLEGLPVQDVVSWNALISGWLQQGQAEEAFTCLDHMQRVSLSPSIVTYLCMLKACGSMGAVDKGERIHDEITRQGLLETDCFLATAVVDMYAKCGALSKAHQVLEERPVQNVVSWNALITGYAQKGQGEKALNCFYRMQANGILPDAETFVCILKACRVVGQVEDAEMFFVSMKDKYGIKPDLGHYACLLEVFGQAGHLDKAIKLIQKMLWFNDASALWSGLLDACCKWGDVNVGRWAFEQALQVDKINGTTYVLMINIYHAAGMSEDAEKVKSMRLMNHAV